MSKADRQHSDQPPPGRRRARRVLFVLLAMGIVLVVSAVLLELVSLALFQTLTGERYDPYLLRVERLARLETLRELLTVDVEEQITVVQHPFLGYMNKPGKAIGFEKGPPFNEYGMITTVDAPMPYKKESGDFVVAILGGSVAEQFAYHARIFLQPALEKLDPRFKDRRVVPLSFGAGGYKQPHQIINLAFALLAGFEIDAVVNIDGFNELALTMSNFEAGVNPVFPAGGHIGVLAAFQNELDPKNIAVLHEINVTRQEEVDRIEWLMRSLAGYSVFANLVAELKWRRSLDRVDELQKIMVKGAETDMAGVFRGPPLDPERPPLEFAAQVWAEGSRILWDICRPRGLLYVHAVQPNQYDEGSKPLTSREREIAIEQNYPWGETIRQGGYDLLRKVGAELREEGVPFHDTTRIFADVEETLYTDVCCHMNERGNELLAETIARLIVEEIARQDFPLAAKFPVVPREGEIDVGGLGDASFLGEGWHAPERWGEMAIRWALPQAEVRFYIPADRAPANLGLTLLARAAANVSGERTIELKLNGEKVLEQKIAPDSLTSLGIPDPLEAGNYVLRISSPDQLKPAQGDNRVLSVAVDNIELRSVGNEAP